MFKSIAYSIIDEMDYTDEGILEEINNSGLKFLEPLSPEETFECILKEALNLIKAEHGSVILYKDGALERVYASSPLLKKLKLNKQGYSYKAYKHHRPYVVDISEIEHRHPLAKKMGAKSIIYIPLSYQNKALGVLVVQSHQTITLAKKELQILKLFGSMASLAIRKAQLYDETKKALDLRNQFISLAAHELRTPLTSINGYTQFLYFKTEKAETQEAKWIKHLYPEVVRLTNMVKDLLDLNKIKAGQFDYYLKECSLVEIIKRAMDSLKFSYPNHKFDFVNRIKKGGDVAIADYDKLLQVIVNLLDNSAKFSGEDKPIKVVLRSNKLDYVITIEDRGKGVSKQDLPHIFDEFYKGYDNQKEGMGVGLHLSKFIIKSLHGEILLDSKEGKGTKVVVKLPKVRNVN